MKKGMKSLLLVVVLVSSIFILGGCGKDYKKELIGTWVFTDPDGAYSARYILKEDGTGTYTITVGEVSDEKNITYKTDGKVIYMTFENDTDVFENKYRIENNNLIVTDSFGTESVFVKQK